VPRQSSYEEGACGIHWINWIRTLRSYKVCTFSAEMRSPVVVFGLSMRDFCTRARASSFAWTTLSGCSSKAAALELCAYFNSVHASKSVPLIALAVGLMEPFDAKHACRSCSTFGRRVRAGEDQKESGLDICRRISCLLASLCAESRPNGRSPVMQHRTSIPRLDCS
jgi:hypothetical protein